MRRESFRGVEKYQIENKKQTRLSANKNKKQLNSLNPQKGFSFLKLKNRASFHVAIIIAVLVTALVGTYVAPSQPTHTASRKNSNLAASANNQQTVLAAGSVLAEKSKNIIAGDIKQKSNSFDNQVVLETAGDGFLAKTQPISTNAIPSTDIISYKTKAGDSLDSLSKKFNVTADTLRWANGLGDKDEIKPDQDITVLPIKGTLYAVSNGDTLESIASRHRASVSLIEGYNSLVAGEPLESGRKILIPDGSANNNSPTDVTENSLAGIGESGDTSLTSYSGSGANGYSYGYCTWYVASRRSVPSNWGNARSWYSAAQASGFKVGSTPVAGAIAWTGVGYAGHVAYVEKVENGQVLVSEMNYNGNWGRRTSRWVSPGAFRYIY